MRLARHSTRYAATLFALALTIALLPADALASPGGGHASDVEQAQAALDEAKALTCDEQIEETVVEQVEVGTEDVVVDTEDVEVGTEHEWERDRANHDNEWHPEGSSPNGAGWDKTGNTRPLLETRDIVEQRPVYEEQETTQLVDNPDYEQCMDDRDDAIAAAKQELAALEDEQGESEEPEASETPKSGTVDWSGRNGDEHLPCTGDLKWVWGGGGGNVDVSNASITVGDAEPVPGEQKGQGAWHFLTPGQGVTVETPVQVTYEGTANERPPVTISECMGSEQDDDDSDDSVEDETPESVDDPNDEASNEDETSTDDETDDSDSSSDDDTGDESSNVEETEVDDPDGNGDEPIREAEDDDDPVMEDTDSSVEPESGDEDDAADEAEESADDPEPEAGDEDEAEADEATGPVESEPAEESDDDAPARESTGTAATPEDEDEDDDAIVTPTRIDAGGGGLADPASNAQGPLAGLLALLGTAIGLVGWRPRRQERLHA